jgi:hypothetical protein
MPLRLRLALPSLGLALFAILSWHSVHWNNQLQLSSSRYFWWASIRLDSDPLNRHPRTASCGVGIEDCTKWAPDSIWITPRAMQRTLMISAFPAFIASLAVAHGLGRIGVSEVLSFMVCTPLFIFAWFYFVGWLLDRRRYKRSLALASTNR